MNEKRHERENLLKQQQEKESTYQSILNDLHDMKGNIDNITMRIANTEKEINEKESIQNQLQQQLTVYESVYKSFIQSIATSYLLRNTRDYENPIKKEERVMEGRKRTIRLTDTTK